MIIHVTPINDLKEHSEDTACECLPRIEVQYNGDIICVHNSYDGREGLELAQELLI